MFDVLEFISRMHKSYGIKYILKVNVNLNIGKIYGLNLKLKLSIIQLRNNLNFKIASQRYDKKLIFSNKSSKSGR
jgi:hypothetical protein